MADGLGFAAFAHAVSDEYDIDNLPTMKPIPLWKKVLIGLCLPITTPIEAFKILSKPKNNNKIQRNKELTGLK